MSTRISRTIYIGLGGTGVDAILQTKRHFIEAYGEIPSIIGFLALDTDDSSFQRELRTTDRRRIYLDASESLRIFVNHSRECYAAHPEIFNWMPMSNITDLPGFSFPHPCVLRTSGRFAFVFNARAIEARVRNVFDRVCNAMNNGDGKWALVDGPVQVKLVFSLGGGTGSGSFLDTAFLIRDLFGDRCRIQAFATLPIIYDSSYINEGNAYGALLDLDYMMTCVSPGSPYSYPFLDESRSLCQKPFDKVYLIDYKTQAGDVFHNRQSLTAALGHTLFAFAGRVGSASDSQWDNVQMMLQDGAYDVDDKKAWACGLGCGEIFYDPDRLGEIHWMRVVKKLTTDLIGNGEVDAAREATLWEERNFGRSPIDYALLEKLLPMSQLPDTAISERKAGRAEEEVGIIMGDAIHGAKVTISRNGFQMQSAAKEDFLETCKAILRRKGGFSARQRFVRYLSESLSHMAQSLTSELKNLKEQNPSLHAAVDDVIDRWKHKSLFSRTDYAGELEHELNHCFHSDVQILRLGTALEIISELRTFIGRYEVEEDPGKMESVLESVERRLGCLLSPDHPCQILVGEKPEQVDTDYIGPLADYLHDECLFGLERLSSEEILRKLEDFSGSLPRVSEASDSLEKVLRDMDLEERKKLFERAMNKAAISLEVSQFIPDRAIQFVAVSIPGGRDGAIAQMIGWDDLRAITYPAYLEIVPSEKENSIFFVHEMGVFPPFLADKVMYMSKTYLRYSERTSFCFDANLEAKLKEMHYSLFPGHEGGETPE